MRLAMAMSIGAPAPRRAFTPKSIGAGTLKHWVEGNVGTTGSWTDQSGQGNNIVTVAGTPTINPTARNGKPGYVSAGAVRMACNTGALGTQKTIQFVGAFGAAAAFGATLVDGGVAGNTARAYFSAATSLTVNSGADLGSTVASLLNFHYYTIIFNGASSVVRQDGVTVATGAAGSTSATGLTLFDFGGGGGALCPGTLCRVAAYASVLSSADYLAGEADMKAAYAL